MRIPFVMALVFAISASAAAQADQRYIVVLHDGVDVDAALADLSAEHGTLADVVLRGRVSGFAGAIGAGRAKALARDPRVKRVEVDGIYQTCRQGQGVQAKPAPSAPATQPDEVYPTGVLRIGAGSVSGSFSFSVAVIDTGVLLGHKDLNVENGATFIPRTSTANDDHGHGTHVAGTIGAVDNTIGVVGVAPGIRIVAVKVLDKRGYSWGSSVVGGINWVTDNALTIKVANMSLGGGASDTLDDAVRASIAAGVTYAVAAGNENVDASTRSPARVLEAVTVAALVDTNGVAGGGTGTTSYGLDDNRASFSNWGSGVDVFAPGVAIRSTWKDGFYNTISGTSMASPHVAGVAALVIRRGVETTPELVAARLVKDAQGTVLGELKGTPNKVVNAAGY